MTAPLLQTKNLVVGYSNISLVDDAQINVSRGELVAVIGRNGTGKSTLLKTLCGLVKPMAGSIMLDGQDIQLLHERERARKVSIVLTRRTPLNGINVRTLVEMGRFPSEGSLHFNKNDSEEIVGHSMKRLGIEHLAEKSMAAISDGELQKAMIAQALTQQAPLILMDEPTSFLDYIAKEELFALLQSIVKTENVGILFTSHDLELVKKYSHRVLVLDKQHLADWNGLVNEPAG